MFYAKSWTGPGENVGSWGPFTSEHEAQERIKDELRAQIAAGVSLSQLLQDEQGAERKMARLWALLLAFTASADSKAEGFEPAAQVRSSGRVMIDGLAFGVYGTSRVTPDELKQVSAITLRLIINGKRGNDLDPEAKQKAQAELDRRVESWTEGESTPTPEDAAAMDASVVMLDGEAAKRAIQEGREARTIDRLAGLDNDRLSEVVYGGAAFSERYKELAREELERRA